MSFRSAFDPARMCSSNSATHIVLFPFSVWFFSYLMLCFHKFPVQMKNDELLAVTNLTSNTTFHSICFCIGLWSVRKDRL